MTSSSLSDLGRTYYGGGKSVRFHLRLGARIMRFEFGGAVTTPLEVRAKLVAMAHVDR